MGMVVSLASDKRIFTAGSIYFLWLLLYAASYYFNLISIPGYLPAAAFMAAVAVCALFAVPEIARLRFDPGIIILFFLFTGRLTAYAADYLSLAVLDSPLFKMPFGKFDYFLFHMLLIAFTGLLVRNRKSPKNKTGVLSFLPVLMLALPVLTGSTVYSFVFTGIAAWSMISAIRLSSIFPEYSGFTAACITAAGLDMLVYAEMFSIQKWIPPDLNYLLLPFALFGILKTAKSALEADLHD